MKARRDPNGAIERPEPDLPRSEWIWCIVIVTIVTVGAVWVSTHLGHHR